MKTIETKVYTFDELSDEAKEKAREWWRRGQYGDTLWQESAIDDMKETGKLFGFTISKVYFTGFSCQGDGAMFEGEFHGYDFKGIKAVKNEWPKDLTLHSIARSIAPIVKRWNGVSFHVKHKGHYYHEHCTQFVVDFDEDSHTSQFIKRHAEADEKDLIEAARKFMRWIYSSLETEWEWTNCDEQVDETIKVNEYTFTEEGKRFG